MIACSTCMCLCKRVHISFEFAFAHVSKHCFGAATELLYWCAHLSFVTRDTPAWETFPPNSNAGSHVYPLLSHPFYSGSQNLEERERKNEKTKFSLVLSLKTQNTIDIK